MRAYRVLLFVCLLAAPGRADEIELTNGDIIADCKVTELAEEYAVVKGGVSRTIPRSEVRRVTYAQTSEETYRKRTAALKEDDLDGHLGLARWCAERRLASAAEAEFLKVIALDPDHEEARAALGYRRHQGRWMTEDEINRANGLVKHKGRWMTPEERDLDMAIDEARELERRIAAEVRRAVDDLGSPDAEKRRQAADRLAQFENAYKVKPFLAALGARSPHARAFVARELGAMKSDLGNSAWAATQGLARRTVWDESEEVRTNAVKSLVAIDHPDASLAAAAYLDEEASAVRIRAADAVARFPDLRAVPPLADALDRALETLAFIARYEDEMSRLARRFLITRDGRRIAIPLKVRIDDELFVPGGRAKLDEEKRALAAALRRVTGQDFGEDTSKWREWYETKASGNAK